MAKYDLSDLGGQPNHDLSDLGGTPAPQNQSSRDGATPSFYQNLVNQAGSFDDAMANLQRTGGSTIANVFSNAANLIPGVNIPSLNQGDLNAPGGQLGQAIGTGMSFALFRRLAAGGELGSGITSAIKSIPAISNALKSAQSIPYAGSVINALISPFAQRTATAAAFGALSEPQDRESGALKGALSSAAVEAPFNALARYGGMISDVPKGVLGDIMQATGRASPQEQQVAMQAAQGIPVPVGDIMQSPALQSMYKGMSYMPFSGVPGQAQKVVGAAEQQSQNILDMLKGDQQEGLISRNIENAIKANHTDAKLYNDSLYADVADNADKLGVKLNNYPNLQSLINDYSEVSDPNVPDKLLDSFKKYMPGEETQKMDPSGAFMVSESQPPQSLSFNDAHALQKDLSKKANAAYGNNNTLGRFYLDASNAMKADMEEAARSSGNPELYQQLLNAKSDFANNVAPYRNPQIFKIITGDKNREQLPSALLQDTDDVNKVFSDLPDEQKKGLAFLKFKPKESVTGEYQSTPDKLFNAYNNLSEVQKSNLFSPQERDEFLKLGQLSQFAKNASGPAQTSGYPLAAGELGSALGAAAFHPMAALGGLGLGASASLGARYLSNLMTNPEYRNALLGLQRFQSPGLRNALRAGALGATITPQGSQNSLNQ